MLHSKNIHFVENDKKREDFPKIFGKFENKL